MKQTLVLLQYFPAHKHGNIAHARVLHSLNNFSLFVAAGATRKFFLKIGTIDFIVSRFITTDTGNTYF